MMNQTRRKRAISRPISAFFIMHQRSLFVCLAVVAALIAVSTASASSGSQHFSRPSASLRHWHASQRIAHDPILKFVFAIKMRNVDALEKVFWAVSDPSSPQYGKFLSAQEVSGLVAPAPADVEAVLAFIRQDAVSIDVTDSGDFVTCELRASAAARLFDTEFKTYKHRRTHKTLVRVDRYSLPDHVARAVDTIGGLTRFVGMFFFCVCFRLMWGGGTQIPNHASCGGAASDRSGCACGNYASHSARAVRVLEAATFAHLMRDPFAQIQRERH
jgi:hypothetical protein